MWKFKDLTVVDDLEFKRSVAEKIKRSDRQIGSIARILLEELACFSGCNRVCLKFPVDVRHIMTLVRWFPDCRVVHITRDPRALAASKANDPSGTAMRVAAHPRLAWAIRKVALALVISQYRLSARMHQQCKALSNYRLFRYEDLLAEPRKTLVELCQFTGTSFSEDMLEPEKGQHEHQPSSLTGKQQKAFDPAAAVRWRKVISPFDNWLSLTFTRRAMARLGYNPETHPILQRFDNNRQAVVCEVP